MPKSRLCLALALMAAMAIAPPAVGQTAGKPLRLLEDMLPGATLREATTRDAALDRELLRLTTEASAKGHVDVVVKTAVPYASERWLSPHDRHVQRREIAQAAEALRKAMPDAEGFAADDWRPYVRLRLDAAGLARIQSVPNLVRIVAAERFNWFRDAVQLRRGVKPQPPSPPSAPSARRTPSMAAPMIIGGENVQPGVHPFQVALLYKDIEENFDAHFCGGALIAASYVLTSAHCSDEAIGRESDNPLEQVNPTDEVQVLVNTSSLSQGGRRVNVKQVHLPPEWQSNPLFDSDVAIWELETPVTDVPYARIAELAPTTPGQLLRMTGWGAVDADNIEEESTAVLQQADLPFIPTVGEMCGRENVKPTMICAGMPTAESAKLACDGDSGGPLTIDRGQGYREIVGIVTRATSCDDPELPVVFTSVAHPAIRQFITSKVTFTPSVSFQNISPTVQENGRSIWLTIERTNTQFSGKVRLRVFSGTATRRDYFARHRSVKFRAGASTASFRISIRNDKRKEGDEQFFVVIDRVPAGFIAEGGANRATVTIKDND